MRERVEDWIGKRVELYRVWAQLWPYTRANAEEWRLLLRHVERYPDAVVVCALRRLREYESPEGEKLRRLAPHPSRVRKLCEEIIGKPKEPIEREPVCALSDYLAEHGAEHPWELVERRKQES